MPAPPPSVTAVRVDAANALVRGLVLLLLVVPFAIAFLYGAWAHVRFGTDPIISAGEFIGAMSVAMTWFFKSRDEKATSDEKATTTNGASHPPALPAAPPATT